MTTRTEYRHIKAWRKKHPEKFKAQQARYRAKNREKERARQRLYSYGLTDDQYQAMLAAQGGKCWICGQTRRLAVDHDHVTGEVRGLLCSPCNGSLGWFETYGRKALDYLAWGTFS